MPDAEDAPRPRSPGQRCNCGHRWDYHNAGTICGACRCDAWRPAPPVMGVNLFGEEQEVNIDPLEPDVAP